MNQWNTVTSTYLGALTELYGNLNWSQTLDDFPFVNVLFSLSLTFFYGIMHRSHSILKESSSGSPLLIVRRVEIMVAKTMATKIRVTKKYHRNCF